MLGIEKWYLSTTKQDIRVEGERKEGESHETGPNV